MPAAGQYTTRIKRHALQGPGSGVFTRMTHLTLRILSVHQVAELESQEASKGMSCKGKFWS